MEGASVAALRVFGLPPAHECAGQRTFNICHDAPWARVVACPAVMAHYVSSRNRGTAGNRQRKGIGINERRRSIPSGYGTDPSSFLFRCNKSEKGKNRPAHSSPFSWKWGTPAFPLSTYFAHPSAYFGLPVVPTTQERQSYA